MTEKEKVEILKKIEFGDVDANADPNLDKYFYDNNYWNKIIEDSTYFVVGKKGTGKSALYKMLGKLAIENGALFSNCDFGDFPFNKLMQLSDDDFSKPNQYQSIWQLVIMNQIVSLIVSNSNSDESNCYYKKIKEYYDNCIGSDTVDLHKTSLTRVRKKEHALLVGKFGINPSVSESNEMTSNYGDSFTNISTINRSLLDMVTDYFKTSSHNIYIVQFDRLDDTYNQYTEKENYFHIIISLMKTVYKINNQFRSCGINFVKTIVYLRTDIIDEIGKRDAESARWEDFTYKLNWSIINKNDWKNPPLLQMLNKRIYNSLKTEITLKDIFESKTIKIINDEGFQKNSERYMNVFKYIINLTLHRPRDLIKFCKCIQKEVIESDALSITYRTIKNAEKEYCYWLVYAEISNEINPIISDTEKLFNLLRSLGSKPFSFNDFYLRYNSAENQGIAMKKDELIAYLYDVGILMNVNRNKKTGRLYFRSKIRNRGTVDRSMKLMIHQGVWKGINA